MISSPCVAVGLPHLQVDEAVGVVDEADARRGTRVTSCGARSAGTRRRDIETYMPPER